MGDSTICRGHLPGVPLHTGQFANGGNARSTSVEKGNQPKSHGQHRFGKSDHVFHHVANGLGKRAERKVPVGSTAGKAIPLDDDGSDGFKELNS